MSVRERRQVDPSYDRARHRQPARSRVLAAGLPATSRASGGTTKRWSAACIVKVRRQQIIRATAAAVIDLRGDSVNALAVRNQTHAERSTRRNACSLHALERVLIHENIASIERSWPKTGPHDVSRHTSASDWESQLAWAASPRAPLKVDGIAPTLNLFRRRDQRIWLICRDAPGTDTRRRRTAANAVAVVAPFVHLKIGAAQQLRWKLFNQELDRFRGIRETGVLERLEPRMAIARREQLCFGGVVEWRVSLPSRKRP